MAGTTATTVNSITAFNSSTPVALAWNDIATDAGTHIDVNGINATKMILLVAAATAPYSAGKLDALKVGCARVTKATAYAVLRSTGTTHLKHVYAIGPFETNRFKDSDGYINIAKGKLGSTKTLIAPIFLP